MHSLLRAVALLCASLLLSLGALELALHLVPVNQGMHTEPVNEAAPILHFEPNRTFTWSRFADFSMANRLHSNNFGFINDQDYDPDATTPLLAVIGDSYVEAAMVPHARTVHGRLAQRCDGNARVYSFGASGAPLSQYLAYARYARETFAPDKLIIIVIGNDFDESLLSAGSAPGFHYFTESSSGSLELVRRDFSPSTLTRLVRKSRLGMYLATNLQVQHLPERFARRSAEHSGKSFAGQTSSEAGAERLDRSTRAMQRFLDLLPEFSGLSPANILLVVDGMRPHLYDPDQLETVRSSFFGQMRRRLMDQAVAGGFQVLDLQPTFIRTYSETGRRFEFLNDGHWNAEGHRVVAEEVARSGFLSPWL